MRITMKLRSALVGLAACGMALAAAAPASAQLTVVDPLNITQSTISALQNVAAVERQIQQYELQVQQFEQMQLNLASPLTTIYGLALADIQGAQNDINGLNNLTNGSTLSAYLTRLENPTVATAANSQALLTLQYGQWANQVTGAQTLSTHVQKQGQSLQTVLNSCSASAVGTTQTSGCLNQIEGLDTQATLELETLVNNQMQTQAADELAAASGSSAMQQLATQAYNAETATWTEGAAGNDMSGYSSALPNGN